MPSIKKVFYITINIRIFYKSFALKDFKVSIVKKGV